MTQDLAAYGVVFADLGGPDSPKPPPTWPRWTVSQEIGPADDSPGMDVWENRARIGIPTVGEFRMDRARREIVLHVQDPWSREIVLHPGLGPAASVVAHWMGRATLHAAAVLIDGRMWGLLGEKGAGKSTIVAHLVGLGCDLMTDDLLVVGKGVVGFAGPGVVDLRGDVGPELGGQPLGVIGMRERWRAALEVGALTAPLGGWVQLGWSEGATTCDELAVLARLALLDRSTMIPPDGAELLRLADLPMFQFTRQYAAGEARADASRLLRLVSGVGAL